MQRSFVALAGLVLHFTLAACSSGTDATSEPAKTADAAVTAEAGADTATNGEETSAEASAETSAETGPEASAAETAPDDADMCGNDTGSYLKSCGGCEVDVGLCTLTCKYCIDGAGHWVLNPSLKLPCTGDIANCNGHLKCGGC